MIKHTRILFWVAELNLLLWLVVFGSVIGIKGADDAEMLKYHTYFCIVGLVFAVVLQHWSYYKIYKPAKEIKRQNKASEATSEPAPSADSSSPQG